MNGGRFGCPGSVSLAVAGAAALSFVSAVAPGSVTELNPVRAEVKLLDTEGWGMGGSGIPIPSQELLTAVAERYLNPAPPLFPGQPVFHVDAVHPLFTPEGWYPITGIKALPFNQSVAEAVTMLNSKITSEIAEGNDVVIGGGSQSSTISSLEMRDLLALPQGEQPTAEELSWLLLVDPSAPNGGILERFGDPSLPPLTVPSLGVTFSGATPSDTPWDTAIYDMEYDGISDFPRYPIDLLSDLNAALGTALVHATVDSIPLSQVAEAVKLPVSDDYTGHTQYFMIPEANLPLLDPLRDIPVVGEPLADLLQPDLKVLVNLGYGDIENGWDPGPANVPTPFELFPTNIDWADVLTALVSGAQKGVGDFVDDLGSLSAPNITEAFTADGDGVDSLPSLPDIVNAFSGAASSAYATLLSTADVVNAIVTALPAYDASLFAQELTSGNLLDAVGMPIAAEFGLTSIGAVIAIRPIVAAAEQISADFRDLIPS